jgi:hypothetical protein
MAQLMISWRWQNASQKRCRKNVLEKFHVQLHICIFKVIKWPIIWENSIHSFEVTHDIQLCDACIKIYILNCFHRAGLHINHAAYEARTYICNSFQAICVWTLTYPQGIPVHLYNHGNPIIILLAKEYESACTLHFWTFESIKQMYLTSVPWYITLHCVCTLVLDECMCVTVPTPWQWPFEGLQAYNT